MRSPGQHYFEEFLSALGRLDDLQLIMRFNREVGNKGWGTARASFLAAMHREFDRRGFDYSSIGDDQCLSLREHVVLDDAKVLIPVRN